MKDMQSQRDERGIAIDLVGVSGVRWPIIAWDRQFEKQSTTATFKLAVALPSEFKEHT